jgi:Nucleotidyl transferase AbiEii toxin, Type IV TA system
MALEVRLSDRARLTKDIDLGLRETVGDQGELHERLVEALQADPYDDWFVLTVEPLNRLMEDGAGQATWRTTVDARLAGKTFGRVKLDISPRSHELDATDKVALPNSLSFAGISIPTIEVIDIQRHAAEKLHGMHRDFGDRDNSRVRDLVDLVILHENGLLEAARLAEVVREVWRERDGFPPPTELPSYPSSWPDRYERLAVGRVAQTYCQGRLFRGLHPGRGIVVGQQGVGDTEVLACRHQAVVAVVGFVVSQGRLQDGGCAEGMQG